ncbi:peptidase M15 [Vibrio aestuarianus]|uniref:peptidase M15 n=1 Tax=Vibrio aestuarianus TaxID=28171 RepID=UPI00237CCC84|nr:peptidase M15 [Vibrio aestuarianus]MDE1249423.1 peptidase M15 [Vibrio aestuarianus]
MKKPATVKSLEEFGRVRLSKNFFMRDFLHSEISQIEGIPNIPDYPDIAIQAGTQLCEQILEPIQNHFGRISIRSAYRSPAVNAKGAENKNQYNCSRNEANYAGHIWDYRDSDGCLGATACIVVNSFVPYYERTGNWQALAWWVHDNVPGYSSMYFFPKLAAFNISWHEKPKKVIKSYIANGKGTLTKPGMDNFGRTHEEEYILMLNELSSKVSAS